MPRAVQSAADVPQIAAHAPIPPDAESEQQGGRDEQCGACGERPPRLDKMNEAPPCGQQREHGPEVRQDRALVRQDGSVDGEYVAKDEVVAFGSACTPTVERGRLRYHPERVYRKLAWEMPPIYGAFPAQPRPAPRTPARIRQSSTVLAGDQCQTCSLDAGRVDCQSLTARFEGLERDQSPPSSPARLRPQRQARVRRHAQRPLEESRPALRER